MLLILVLFLSFLLSPSPAWAYFDPGFGGYLINSIISLIVTGFAFVSAAVVYFFRTIIGKKLSLFWQKHKKLYPFIFLFILGIVLLSTLDVRVRIILGSIFPYLMGKAFVDPTFDKYLSIFLILLSIITFAFICTVVMCFFHRIIDLKVLNLWQKLRKICFITLVSFLLLGSLFLIPFFRPHNNSSNYPSKLLGAHIFDFQRMSKGYSLYDGTLIDEKGRIIKKWANGYLGVIDKNGDYYGEYRNPKEFDKNSVWGRYTWNDRVIWEKNFLIHHELYLSPKGTIFVFNYELHNYNAYKVNFDNILEFDKNGKQLQRYSFWDHLKEFQSYHAEFGIDAAFFPCSPLILLWHKFFPWEYDYFHINSFFMIPPNPLEGKNPAFRPGNWLISIFHGSMVFILDQDTKKILWHAVNNEIEGGLQGQHAVSMLPDGDILIFDNGINRCASRILIIDPLTLKIKWQYTNKNFFSAFEGFVQALPNGNFLITESEKGHSFEVTRDKKIVWEYYDTTNNSRNIYRTTRYPKEMIDQLFNKNVNDGLSW